MASSNVCIFQCIIILYFPLLSTQANCLVGGLLKGECQRVWLVKSIPSLGREPSLLKPAQGFLLILSEAGEILLPFQEYNSVGFSVQRSKPIRKGDCCCGSPFQRLLSKVAWPHMPEPDIMEVQGHSREQLFTSSEQEGESKRKWPGVLHLNDPPPFVSPDSSSLGKLLK